MIFKRNKKVKPNHRKKVLRSISEGLKLGETNKEIGHIQKVLNLATSGDYKGKPIYSPLINRKLEEDHKKFFSIMLKGQERFDAEQKKKLEELKRQNKFWYKTKSKIRAKYMTFRLNMKEIGAFIRHEFYSIRKLIFLTHDLFFGPNYKNRKLFYNYKDQIIRAQGYMKGEVRYNSMIRNITNGAKLNKKLLKTHG
jgi:hypothetical protein